MTEDKKIIEFFCSGICKLMDMICYEIGEHKGNYNIIFYCKLFQNREELRKELIKWTNIFNIKEGFEIQNIKEL